MCKKEQHGYNTMLAWCAALINRCFYAYALTQSAQVEKFYLNRCTTALTVNAMENFEHVYAGVRFQVITGDIIQQAVEAIVNPANSQLIMGGGVAGAILRAGGREIQEEALKKAPVPVGKAITTKAGKLKARYVIHAPTMERPAMATGKEKVKLAVRAALELAQHLGVRSMAFPGMGTGVGGLNVEEAAQVMIDEIKKHVETGSGLEKVILVGFGEDLTRAFENALRKNIT